MSDSWRRLSARRRHRRHLHRRDADRRGDRRRLRSPRSRPRRTIRRSASCDATDRILATARRRRATCRYVVHGTTVATNAIIEGKIARDRRSSRPRASATCWRSRRQIRPSLYDLQFEKPRPLVPRDLCFGVPERLDRARRRADAARRGRPSGAVARRLAAEGVEAVAVCLLHAYVNPAHEQRAGEILPRSCPDVRVSLSSEVAPEIPRVLPRQHDRDQRRHPADRRALSRHRSKSGCASEGVDAELLVMQSERRRADLRAAPARGRSSWSSRGRPPA